MKIKEVFEKTVQFFREKGIEQARLEAELLLSYVIKTDRIGIYLKYEAPMNESEVKQMRDLVMRKSKGEPTAYLIGEKFFYNRKFCVGAGVLIPRPETEQIIESILKQLNKNEFNQKNLKIVDLGSGSGCIGLTLGLELTQSEVFLIEKSKDAFLYLQKNFNMLIHPEDQPRFHLINSSVEEWKIEEKFDVIVANPPYIDSNDLEISAEVKKFEPEEALFSENQGLADIKSWLDFVIKHLSSNGLCLFEIGHKQGEVVSDLFSNTNYFQSVEILKDFSQKDRIIFAIRNQ